MTATATRRLLGGRARPQNPRQVPWIVATVYKLTHDRRRPHVRQLVPGSVAERIDEWVRWSA